MSTAHTYVSLQDRITHLTSEQRYPFSVTPDLSIWQTARVVEVLDQELDRIAARQERHPDSTIARIDQTIISSIRNQVAGALDAAITEASKR